MCKNNYEKGYAFFSNFCMFGYSTVVETALKRLLAKKKKKKKVLFTILLILRDGCYVPLYWLLKYNTNRFRRRLYFTEVILRWILSLGQGYI